MSITIELQGLGEEDSFQTILDHETTLLKIGEMIQEAQYYQSFNLSEQFCLQIKDTNKFISRRQTVVKDCLSLNQIDAKELIFHKGLEGQKKMLSGITIDQNDQNQIQTAHYQPINQNSMKKNNDIQQGGTVNNQQSKIINNQLGGGIQIGGNISETQHLRKFEQQQNYNPQVVEEYQGNSSINLQYKQLQQQQQQQQQQQLQFSQFSQQESQIEQLIDPQNNPILQRQGAAIKINKNQVLPQQGGQQVSGELSYTQYLRQMTNNESSNNLQNSQIQEQPNNTDQLNKNEMFQRQNPLWQSNLNNLNIHTQQSSKKILFERTFKIKLNQELEQGLKRYLENQKIEYEIIS
ncbi:unnamed protein product [Paramecium sonneborni]|uniref:Uncharacterized protein n=1 Tax=Paramecium sonneborni TaxID=65129 RepID=A0A8S1M8R1_9CILI|nr:unnamed protein product [Paramecium sonneborni]